MAKKKFNKASAEDLANRIFHEFDYQTIVKLVNCLGKLLVVLGEDDISKMLRLAHKALETWDSSKIKTDDDLDFELRDSVMISTALVICEMSDMWPKLKKINRSDMRDFPKICMKLLEENPEDGGIIEDD
jgi:hypothetical protein